MKIGGPGSTAGPQAAGARRPAGEASGYAAAEASAPARGAAPASAASAAAMVGGLDALLALQDVGGPLERRRRARARGGRLLDDLDKVQLAILDGGDPRAALQALAASASQHRERGDDAGLDEVLDAIDLRAAVELAKAETSALAGPRT